MSLPESMQHIGMAEPGDPDVMTLCTSLVPDCRPHEVLIKVAAAGVNRPDLLQRAGAYPPPDDASPILGLEVSGVVVSAGAEVTAWSVGDRVCALTNGGGYAQYVAVPAGQCLAVPHNVSMTMAASLPETYFTVWSNVFMEAKLAADETLLVHGGSGGIGAAAIQLAKAQGSRVIATAGSKEKCDYCLQLGASAAINYREQDFVDEVKAITEGRGANVILDMVGGEYVAKNIKAAAMDGRIVNIAYLHGSNVTLNLMPVMLKRLYLTGSTLRPRTVAYKAEIARQLANIVWPWLASGRLVNCVEKVFPLAAAAAAHRWLDSGDSKGKVVLDVALADLE